MASGADIFLSSFNRIEKQLRDDLGNPRNMGFSEMVRRLSKQKQGDIKNTKKIYCRWPNCGTPSFMKKSVKIL